MLKGRTEFEIIKLNGMFVGDISNIVVKLISPKSTDNTEFFKDTRTKTPNHRKRRKGWE